MEPDSARDFKFDGVGLCRLCAAEALLIPDAGRPSLLSKAVPGAGTRLDAPVVSVVVSTFSRAHLLARLVDALAVQEISVPFEVLIVDNGSSDDTPAVLERLSAAATFDLQTLRIDQNQGPAPARNLGWQKAR